MTQVFIVHDEAHRFGHLDAFFRKTSTPLIVDVHVKRMERLDHLLDNLRVSFADIASLDAAARGQARSEILRPLEKAPVEPPFKPTAVRVAGQDIRRFIPRRSM